jgi:phosphate transport system substrate-binding protein
MKKIAFAIVAMALAASPAFGADKVTLTGAGATFPYPLYSKWFSQYNKLHPDIEVNYQSIGSGGGIQQITEHTVDFGASDAPLTDEQLAKAGDLLHVPTTLGAVVITYNAPIQGTLRIGPETLASIFLGKIRKWNDPAIAAENPGLALPSLPIAVVHRSDGSGTVNVFTDYLSTVSPEWKAKVGKGTSVNWPTGIGAKGNEGVSGQVKQIKGAIGFVELAYAIQNKMPMAELKNREGEWVEATPKSISLAAAGAAANMPADLRVSIVNAPGQGAYPISAFTYILVYRNLTDPVKARALVDLLWWATHEGQDSNEALSYARLPESVVKLDEAKLRSIQCQGKPLLPGA